MDKGARSAQSLLSIVLYLTGKVMLVKAVLVVSAMLVQCAGTDSP